MNTGLQAALDAFAQGEPVCVFDAENREGETDLLFPALSADPAAMRRLRQECGGLLFLAIGHTPNTAFLNGQIAMDDKGYLEAEPGRSFTSVEGVFAAGDVQDTIYRQAVTAAGSGCAAAMDCEKWLESR